jgi:DNA-binding transcriptional LysR family regulator
MELRNLKAFHHVADGLNITKAAEQLGYSQPAVTTQIKMLEREIGTNLFERAGRQIVLTPSGEIMKQYVNQIFSLLNDMTEKINETKREVKPIIIAAPESYCIHYLPFLVSDLVRQNINLQLITCNSNRVMELLSRGKVDIGVVAGSESPAEFESTILEKEDCLLVISSELYRKNKKKDMLRAFPYISFQAAGSYKKVLDHCLQQLRLSSSSVIEFESEEAIKKSVLNQTGITLLSATMAKSEIESGALHILHRFREVITTSLLLSKNSHHPDILLAASIIQSKWMTIPAIKHVI